jgi:UDP-N-acetyl-2-amino-2-deoxyglucuronate dehydrogenase
MSSPVRFAVVGLGMGLIHCQDLVDAEGCELVAVCDSSPERLRATTEKFGVRACESFEALLRDPEVEVVSICTPSGTHADLSIQALRAGKHVVCEKPPDVSVEAVDRMIAARDATGRELMVIFQARFEPVYIHLREAIQSGRLGRLIGLHGTVNWYRAQSYFVSPGMWKGTWALDGGGSLANQGVHTADLLQWLGGPVAEVYGKFGRYAHDIESEDKTAALLTFANGALGTLTTTTAAYPGLERSVMVHGSRGSAVIQDDYLVRWRVRPEGAGDVDDTSVVEKEEERALLAHYGKKEKREGSTASDPFAFATRGHLLQFEAFARALRAGERSPNSVETTRHTVELFCAVYESGRIGAPVRVGQSQR